MTLSDSSQKITKKIILVSLGLVILFWIGFGWQIFRMFSHRFTMPNANFSLFGIVGHYYGLILYLAIVLGFVIAWILARSKKILLEKYVFNIFAGIFWALLFARFGYVIFKTSEISNFWQIFAIWQGGLSIHGAIVGIGLYIGYLAIRYKINFWQFADFFAPALALGQAIGRWGNFINQEAYGSPTNLPWKMFIDPTKRIDFFDNFQFFHPTFLYESIGDFTIFLILLYIFGLNKKNGTVAIWYIFLYSILRFILEYFRIDRVSWGFFSVAQWASLIIVIAIIVWFWRKNMQEFKTG